MLLLFYVMGIKENGLNITLKKWDLSIDKVWLDLMINSAFHLDFCIKEARNWCNSNHFSRLLTQWNITW